MTTQLQFIIIIIIIIKIPSNILLSRLIPPAEEIIGDHQYVFTLNRSRSTTDHIFCIRQLLDKKLRIK